MDSYLTIGTGGPIIWAGSFLLLNEGDLSSKSITYTSSLGVSEFEASYSKSIQRFESADAVGFWGFRGFEILSFYLLSIKP